MIQWKKTAVVVLGLLMMGAGTVQAAAPRAYNGARIRDVAPVSARFSSVIEDLPLMEGLDVEQDDVVQFTFGDDRIVQTSLKGRVDVDQVYYFYQATLPQLGWSEVSPKIYERQGERLSLQVRSTSGDGMTHVRFEIQPLGQ